MQLVLLSSKKRDHLIYREPPCFPSYLITLNSYVKYERIVMCMALILINFHIISSFNMTHKLTWCLEKQKKIKQNAEKFLHSTRTCRRYLKSVFSICSKKHKTNIECCFSLQCKTSSRGRELVEQWNFPKSLPKWARKRRRKSFGM